MSVVWYRLRADLRVRWRALVLLAVLVGVGGGVALTAFAGARRTSAAVPQMLAYSRPDDGDVVFGGFCPPPTVTGPLAGSLAPLPVAARMMRLPPVAAFTRMPYVFLSASRSGPGLVSVNVTAVADAAGFGAVNRPLLVAGRFPGPGRPFDAAVNEIAAERLHLSVGSRLTLYGYSQQQVRACDVSGAAGRLPAPAGPRFSVRVAGIVRFPSDVSALAPLAAAQQVAYERESDIYLTRAFLPRYAAALGVPVQDLSGMNEYYVRVRGGLAGWHVFSAEASRLDRGATVQAGGGGGGGARLQVAAASAERGTRLEVVALLLFGTLAAFVTLLLVGQALARQMLLEEADLAILAGLGMSRAQIFGLEMLRAALIGVAGGVLAAAAAVAASPVMPVGLARQAEISPGVSADALVLGHWVRRHCGAGGGGGRAARLAGEPPRPRAA